MCGGGGVGINDWVSVIGIRGAVHGGLGEEIC